MTSITGIATSFINFTRASNATVTDSDGRVKWAPSNLLTNSESFDAAAWTKNISLIAANSIAAPNGTTTADKLYPSTSGTKSGVLARPTAVEEQYTLSVYAKAGGKNFITFTDFSAGSARAWANLSTGAKTETAGYFLTVTSAGSGWWRCDFTQTAKVASPYAFFIVCDADSSDAVTVNGTDGIYIWGAHLYRSDLGGMQTNTSAYPMYNPTTPKNLLGYTESLTTGWTNSNTTDAIASEVNPVGLTGAVDVAATAGNGTLLGSLSLLASPYTFSIWLKRKTGSGTVEITVDGTTYVAAAVTGTWTRFSTTLTPTAGTKTPGIRLVTSGDAVYAWGAQLSDSASLDPYVPVYGAAVTSAAYYGPRRDFDPVTLACKGLLVEEQRVNLIRYSRTLETTGSYWGGLASGTANTITIDNAPGPDGLLTSASMLTYNTAVTGAGTYSAWRHTLSTTANGTYTFTVWLKAGTTSSVYLRFNDSGGNRANTLCTLTSSWQRFTVTGTTTASITTISCDVGADGNVGGQTLTAGTIYAYGAQLELGGFATSYVPNGSTVNGTTRNADVASVSTQAFPYLQGTGTIVANNQALSQMAGAFMSVASLASGLDESNLASVGYQTSGATTRMLVINTGSSQADLSPSGSSASTPNKLGLAFATNDSSAVVNGGTAATDPTSSAPVATGLFMGASSAQGISRFNGHIRQITYLPRRISNAELITRTS